MLDTEARTSNFGTIPSMLWGTSATESWWIGLSRQAFMERAQIEQARMKYSKGANWVDGLKVHLD